MTEKSSLKLVSSKIKMYEFCSTLLVKQEHCDSIKTYIYLWIYVQ